MNRLRLILPLIALLFPALLMSGDSREALESLRHVAEEGNPKAMWQLAELYDRGLPGLVEADTVESLRLYRKAAEAGSPEACNYLGFLFYNGKRLKQSTDSALYWIERAAAAGDSRAANNLGWLLIEGKGVVHDNAKAMFWFRKAADAGLPAAQAQLADMMRLGRGCEADTAAAEQLYDAAIQGGLADAEKKLLAMSYRSYRSLAADSARVKGVYHYLHRAPVIGVTLFEIAAEKGDTVALTLLGDAYARGQGVPFDFAKSAEYYHKAASMGEPSASYILSQLLEIYPDAIDAYEPDSSRRNPEYWSMKAEQGAVLTEEECYRRLMSE